MQCNGSHNSLSKTGTGGDVVRRTGIYVQSGQKVTIEKNYSTTISNSASINAVPEFLSLGYQYQLTVGDVVSFEMYNSASYTREILLYAYYDNYRVTHYNETYNGSGVCRVSTSYKKVYSGGSYGF